MLSLALSPPSSPNADVANEGEGRRPNSPEDRNGGVFFGGRGQKDAGLH